MRSIDERIDALLGEGTDDPIDGQDKPGRARHVADHDEACPGRDGSQHGGDGVVGVAYRKGDRRSANDNALNARLRRPELG